MMEIKTAELSLEVVQVQIAAAQSPAFLPQFTPQPQVDPEDELFSDLNALLGNIKAEKEAVQVVESAKGDPDDDELFNDLSNILGDIKAKQNQQQIDSSAPGNAQIHLFVLSFALNSFGFDDLTKIDHDTLLADLHSMLERAEKEGQAQESPKSKSVSPRFEKSGKEPKDKQPKEKNEKPEKEQADKEKKERLEEKERLAKEKQEHKEREKQEKERLEKEKKRKEAAERTGEKRPRKKRTRDRRTR